jgi:hypothetical protein
MNESMFPVCRKVYECWSQVLTSIVWNQWKLLDVQYEASLGLLDAVCGRPSGEPGVHGSLDRAVAERVQKGLSPPREAYQVQNRGRIDWSRYPDWARPIDPEVFEGCSHEG